MHLIKKQQMLANEHFETTIFVEGAAGTGKTTAAIERVKSLLKAGVPADSILVLVPQATLGLPYRTALRRARLKGSIDIKIGTLGSLAFEMVDLFWPLIADESGIADPYVRPYFLTLEMVQYAMMRWADPEMLRRDYFNSVKMNRSRLFTQIVDNLNKAAVVDFPHTEIGARLKAAWSGEPAQSRVYDDAQAAAALFREICLQHNLLDFSLEVELFRKQLWPKPPVRDYLTRRYRHLIVDHLEDDTPVTHDFLREWLPDCTSAALLFDAEGGFRRFLGADPTSAAALRDACAVQIVLDKDRVMSESVSAFRAALEPHLKHTPPPDELPADPRSAIRYPLECRYHPQMIDLAVEYAVSLVRDQGVPPGNIVMLSAFVPDALRFSLQSRLDARGIPSRTHRPSRALRDEPAARAMLTFARLAYPAWALSPSPFDVTAALQLAIADLDLIRARLLTTALYVEGALLPFAALQDAALQSRISFELGEHYDRLAHWLATERERPSQPVDIFFSRLFGEVLSQPNFGFHRQFDAATAIANLIDSARAFRQALEQIDPEQDHAREYVQLVERGVIANLYVRDAQADAQDAILIAPAYTFLTYNLTVDHQIWLNIGSPAWGQRLFQPLTQPHVLSRQWPPDTVWTDLDEVTANQDTLWRLVNGLLRRCRQGVYLGYSELSEQGAEQRGPLLMAVQHLLRRLGQGERHV